MTGKILIVDDVLPNLKLLQVKLQNEYFDVTTAMSGPEALRRVQEQRPDIVLLDVMMPGMDGYEVCEILKSDPATRDIAVVMVTALSDRADRVRGLEVGADDFLSKPINDVALLARVRSLMRLKATADQWRLRRITSSALGMAQEPEMCDISDRNASILVIEDNAPDAHRLVAALEEAGHRPTLVQNLAQAQQSMASQSFELVFISLSLRDEDGLRLCARLRADDQSRQMPIMLIADDGEINRLSKGLELGANDYVVRPFDRHELRLRVSNQVRRRRYADRLVADLEARISMALTDQLTGLYNRRYAIAHLSNAMALWTTEQKPFCVMLFDIDFFKPVNDTHGHDAGDAVLVQFADRLRRCIRGFDLLARFGGEEFILILPDTEMGIAAMVGERLRQSIEVQPFSIRDGRGEISITTSIGVAQVSHADGDADAVLRRADQALYAAKRTGRNRVSLGTLDAAARWEMEATAAKVA